MAFLLAFALSLACYPRIPQAPGAFFLAALLATAARAGVAPGIAVTVLSSAAMEYFFIPPLYTLRLTPQSAAATGVYAGVAFLVGMATESARRAQRRAERAKDEAEDLAKRLQDQGEELRESNRLLEQKQRELQATLDELSDRDRFRNEFLAMLAHELRNPLAPISNAVNLLRHRVDAEDPRAHSVEIIARQTKHLARLVDDLLDVSRITQGKIRLDLAPLDLRQALQHSVDACRPLIEQREHHLQWEPPQQPLFLNGDATRLVQIFSNLLTNAAKYTDPGGLIVLTVALENDEAVVTVRDNGRGIEPALLPRLFDLFVQADRSLDRSDGGLGVGLSLAQSLVHLHGGNMAARSDGAARGAQFEVRLPLSPSSSA